LICTLRLELDTPAAEVAGRLLDLASRVGPGPLLLVAYPDSLADWIESPDEDAVLDVVDTLADADFSVADLLVVTQGRYFSQMCTDPVCCPPGGRPVPTSTTVTEAALVADGVPAAAGSRSEVAARYALTPQLAPSPEQLQDATAVAAAGGLRAAGEDALRALKALAVGTGPLAPSDVAAVQVGLQDVHVRDWVLAHLATDPIDRAGIDALVRSALAAPDDLRPRVAGAAAAALYAAGDNPVAVWTLIDHAGTDSLAALVAASIDVCTPPTVLREVFAEARLELEARLDADCTIAS
jgi:hypothetical protein